MKQNLGYYTEISTKKFVEWAKLAITQKWTKILMAHYLY